MNFLIQVTAATMVRTKPLFSYYFLLSACFIWIYVEGMIVIPERGNMSYMNPKYIEHGLLNIRRYSRKSPYYINIMGTIKHTWTNNITFYVTISQFLHNEYRRSFVEFRYKFCDLVNKEPYIGGMIKKAGIVCPFLAGSHVLGNMTAPTQQFPSVFPFEKGRADVTLSMTDTEETVLQLFVEATFKQKP